MCVFVFDFLCRLVCVCVYVFMFVFMYVSICICYICTYEYKCIDGLIDI